MNIRVVLKGYYQAWSASTRLDEAGDIHCLLSNNRGEIERVDSSGERSSIALGHDADVIDLNIESSQGLLATASRDHTVGVFELSEKQDQVRERVRIKEFPLYPRRVRFGARRETLCIADRLGNVYFAPLDRLLQQEDSLAAQWPALHSRKAALVCLVAGLDAAGEEVFYTAGYDGDVRRFCKSRAGQQPWVEDRVYEVPKQKGSKGNEKTIRALILPPESSHSLFRGSLLAGTEGGQLVAFNLDDKAIRFTVEIGEPVFSVDVHPERSQLAIGSSNGGVKVYEFDDQRKAQLLFQKVMDCQDIVRNIRYLPNQQLFVASWSGRIEIFESQDGQQTWFNDPGKDHWDPSRDDGCLIFDKTEVDKIRMLSPRFLDYLKSLSTQA